MPDVVCRSAHAELQVGVMNFADGFAVLGETSVIAWSLNIDCLLWPVNSTLF